MRILKRAVVIGNGVPGAENQCIGLVRALSLFNSHTLYRVTRPRGGIHERLRFLPVSLHKIIHHLFSGINGEKLTPFPAQSEEGFLGTTEADAKRIAKFARETFDKDGPTLVVASGRDTLSVASSIRSLAPESVFVVQIQHPRSRLNRFDLVITPRHDYYRLRAAGQKRIPWLLQWFAKTHKPPDRNVVLTLGALHRADYVALQTAASSWKDELDPLPKPLLAVNIGGPTKRCRYGAIFADQLKASLQKILPICGSIRMSFSRRTPKQVSDILFSGLRNHSKVHIWNGEGPNPHMGNLAWADAFVITADSVSMLSEACSTGKPVYVFGAEQCTGKIAYFHKLLQDRGATRPFTGVENVFERWSYHPINDNEEAANQVIKALADRGWTLSS